MSCVIVLGCFRSGTSGVAGILHHLGVTMGKEFDEPNQNNPKGFWEDKAFKTIHTWCDEGREVDQLYENLVRDREEEFPLWGVKDPLLCLYIHKLTGFLKTDHKLIVCRRPIEEISKSMGRSIGFDDPEMFLNLAKYYVEEMEKSLNSYRGPVLEVRFKDLNKSVLGIANFVGLPVNEQALKFIDGNLS